jgi:hypothetical protein
MKKSTLALLAAIFLFPLLGCSISLVGTPTPPAPFPGLSSPTQANTPATLIASPTATPLVAPTATPLTPSPTVALPTVTHSPAPTVMPTATSTPSGPYAVILVVADDVLNIRSTAGAGNPIIGTFSPTATNVMRTGPTAYVGADLWVEVQIPGGGTGWVNAHFLTEYVSPSAFCADGKVVPQVTKLGTAFTTANGDLLSSLVSPAHGMAVRYWRYYASAQNIFDPLHASAVFESTYSHNWGLAAGSGLPTEGSFHEVVLPKLLDVFNASYNLTCNTVQTGGASYDTSWPAEYTNFNFYSVYRPGATGDELNWRTWLVGVEYIQGQPYVVALIQFQWEP